MKYMVSYTFTACSDEHRADVFNNNGGGFSLAAAYEIANQLRLNGFRNVTVEPMDPVPGGRYWEPEQDPAEGQEHDDGGPDALPFE